MRPLEPAGSGGTATAGLVELLLAALTGLAALDTVADLAVLRVEGKLQFYQSTPLGHSSLDKHAAPIGVKAIPLADRMLVSTQDPLTPGEGRHQHQQCGLRQVKVGEHGADDAE